MNTTEKNIEYILNEIRDIKEGSALERRTYQEKNRDDFQIKELKEKLEQLRSRVTSCEFERLEQRKKSLDTDQQKLESEKQAFEATKKLEYNKGYADAYIELTRKMAGD